MKPSHPSVIAVAIAKGGTGKTTTALALAYLLALQGYRVVLVDADPQASATAALGVDVLDESVLPNTVAVVPVALPGLTRSAALSLAPGGWGLSRLGEREMQAHVAHAGNGADAVVVDCGPALTPAVCGVLRGCTHLVMPMTADFLAFRGFNDVRQFTSACNPGAVQLAVLTVWRPRLRLSRVVEAALLESVPALLSQVRIPSDARCAEAPSQGVPVAASAPTSRAAAAYAQLAAELVHMLPPPQLSGETARESSLEVADA